MNFKSEIEWGGGGVSHKCLICSAEVVKESGTRWHSTLEKQVQVIFILNKVLELPSSHLVGFLKQFGNPDCWIRLCEKCNEDVEYIKKIYRESINISMKWNKEKKIVQEKIRRSSREIDEFEEKDDALSHISKECLKFISQPVTVKDEIEDEDDLEQDTNNDKIDQAEAELYWDENDDVADQPEIGSANRKDDEKEEFEGCAPDIPPEVKEIGGKIACRICSRTFTTREAFNGHVKVHRKGSKRACDDCDMTFDFQIELDKHLREVHNRGSLRCPVPGCPKTYTNNELSNFKLHVAKHTGQEPKYKCNLCERSFYSRCHLKRHTKAVHMRIVVGTCSSCGKEFHRKYTLDFHIRQGNCGNFECDLCDRKFTSAILFKQHKEKHEKSKVKIPTDERVDERPVICHICGQSYASKRLKRHVVLVHEKKFSIFCHLCGVGTQTNAALQTHMAYIHNIGKFKCEVEGCGKVFAFQCNLADHTKYIHEGHQKPKKKKRRLKYDVKA